MAVTLPGPILTLIRDVVLMKYSDFFYLTMLVYDYILTLPDEVQYIWPWEWRAGKTLYFATKYLAFVDAALFIVFWYDKTITANRCRSIFNAALWFMTTGTLIAEWILCMRTYAIWGKSKKVMVPLVAFVLAAQVGGVYAVKNLTDSIQWALSPFPSISRCYIIVTRENLLFAVYILTTVKELVIFVLTVWKGVSQWRASKSPLINTLYKDGVLYFFVVFAASLLNFAMTIIGPKKHQTLLTFLMPECVLFDIYIYDFVP
ncbi:hypothetical protein SCHPADRAFT_425773 [Schizopora paradoxa]|uniref:DUF6533 domain-containing protein n=1 Tax=Schizopora paradoxa TaxID=27342 RepID=A0A0H2S5Y1_9AGAM|nr:hypothetical protein SCHPADRAFT_425773 [Schizopora paradoxa]